MGRMAGIHADRMIRALEQRRVVRSKGSHHSLAKAGRPGGIVVPLKKGRTLPEGTARGILRQAGVSEEEFLASYR